MAPLARPHAHPVFAFFAPGNDARAWLDGWYPGVAAAQFRAAQSTERADWWSAVAPRVLVIQRLQDRMAVPENGRRYVAEVAKHATLCEIDGAGHALLPERPDEIANALIEPPPVHLRCTVLPC